MKRILIIEDDKVVAGVYKQRFLDAGYLVDLAPDGLEGVKLVTSVKPDVVLLDLLMPRMDGIEVLKFIRSHPDVKYMPVVVFSNSFMTNLVEAAWRAGADQCLMKASTTPTQLFDAINKAMAKGAMRKPAAPPGSVPAVNPLMRPSAPPAAAPVAPNSPPNPARVSPTPPAPASKPSSNTQAPTPRPAPAPARAPSNTSPASQTGTAHNAAPERTAGHIHAEADPEFQAQIRQLFLSSSASKLSSIRNLATSLVQGGMQQSTLLTELFRKIHSMTGNAALAGCRQIAEFASTFEALLQELLQQPAFVNASTRRTIAKAVDFLELQFHSTGILDGEAQFEEKVLVLEADPVSAKNIQQTLAQIDLKTEMSVDAAEAIGLMASGPYSLVVVPAEMPGISGFELFAQMQSLPGHAHTPAIFLTGFETLAEHSNPEVLGDNDVLAKPHLGIELILKAVMGLQRRRLS